MLRWIAIWITILFWLLMASVAAGQGTLLEVTLGDARLEGTVLAWDSAQVCFLTRDGALWKFSPREVRSFRSLGEVFRPLSAVEMRNRLAQQLGPDFRVTTTAHYVVAFPRHSAQQWPQWFEQLYREFVHYFSIRGFTLKEPRCPLVAIVCRDRELFFRLGKIRVGAAPGGVVGYYSLQSNRIVVWDQSSVYLQDASKQNQATVVHEAVHQLAYNTGVHNRFLAMPLWLVEGLATVFEAPGVYDYRGHPLLRDRVNRERLAGFQAVAEQLHRGGWLQRLVCHDDLFQLEPSTAYSLAWAVSFYLAERRPQQYAELLKQVSSREAFTAYGPEERKRDFEAVFGTNWPLLEAEVVRFIATLE